MLEVRAAPLRERVLARLQHDRGRLSPEDIERMCAEAEAMRTEDERAERENLAAMERGDEDDM